MHDEITEGLQVEALNAIESTPGILLGSSTNPYSVLVYTKDSDTVERIEIQELRLRYPCSGRNARWNHESFSKAIAQKAILYRKNGGILCIGIPHGPFPYPLFTVYEGAGCRRTHLTASAITEAALDTDF